MAASVHGNGGDFADIAIATGDNVDNAQRNELDACLALLDGGTFALPYDGPQRSTWADDTRADDLRADGLWPFWLPDGGAPDMWRSKHGFPVVPGLLDATGDECNSPGLGLPWLGVLGNHDVMRQGTVYSPPALESIAIGDWRAISPGPTFDPADPFAAYMADPTAFSDGPHRRAVSADPDRRTITPAEFIRAHRDRGRGFASETSGDYVHDTEHVRLVVLDTNHPTGHYQGSVGEPQLGWLDQQLTDAGVRAVVVISHHGRVAMDNTYGNGPDTDRRLGDAMAEVLHRHDNVVAWLVGHRHVHRIQPVADPAGRGIGYWEITTSSIIDWPNQARIVEIIRGTDGSVGVRTTVVDHDAAHTSPDTPWQSRLGALHRELAYNSGRVFSTRGTEGRPGDRNTVLARPPR
jgi:metallophosphoesterase (TIGR03767 family)